MTVYIKRLYILNVCYIHFHMRYHEIFHVHSHFMCTDTAVCCSVLQCVAVCCSVLQCVAACYVQPFCVYRHFHCISYVHMFHVLQCVAVCCSALQCVAVCCSVLQCVAVRCSVLQCVAVCYVTQTLSLYLTRRWISRIQPFYNDCIYRESHCISYVDTFHVYILFMYTNTFMYVAILCMLTLSCIQPFYDSRHFHVRSHFMYVDTL